MGQNLDSELIAAVQGELGVAAPANASGRASDAAEVSKLDWWGEKVCDPRDNAGAWFDGARLT